MALTTTHLQYANGYIELGMFTDAAKELDSVNENDQLCPDVLSLRCKIYLEQRNWKRLALTARHLAEHFPHNEFGWVNWAYALREQGRITQALSVAIQGSELHPEDAVLHFNLSCYYSLLGNLENAFNSLQRAVSIEPSFADDARLDPDLANLRNSHNAN